MHLYAEKLRAPSLRNEKVSFKNYQTLKNYLYILYEIEKIHKQMNTFHTNQTDAIFS